MTSCLCEGGKDRSLFLSIPKSRRDTFRKSAVLTRRGVKREEVQRNGSGNNSHTYRGRGTDCEVLQSKTGEADMP